MRTWNIRASLALAFLVACPPPPADAAIISRVITFTDGSILTASQLNTEFNNVVNGVNSINNDNIVVGANIDPSKISSAIKGSAITRNGGTGQLSVSVDASTIEIASDQLRVKDGGITTAKLAAAVLTLLQPTGMVLTMSTPTCPTGFLLADGSAVSRTTYAALYAAIGITHGQGDAATTFNLPNYSGRFLRGVANGVATDPDRLTRTAMATGGNTGDNVGSVQSDGFGSHNHGGGSHTHTLSNSSLWQSFGGAGNIPAGGANLPVTVSVNSSGTIINTEGGNETRPENAYVTYCVKF